jgi:hypothetical protein
MAKTAPCFALSSWYQDSTPRQLFYSSLHSLSNAYNLYCRAVSGNLLKTAIMNKLIIITGILIISYNSPAQKNQISEPSILQNKDQNSQELEYLKIRDAYIEDFRLLQKKGVNDSLLILDNKALLDLENRLRDILKDSHFSTIGNINLETLLGYIGFGMLDGLEFMRDSVKIFYTTKNLFFKYFNKKYNLDQLGPKEFESIFQSAFASDWALADFTDIKIPTKSNGLAYGMAAMGFQMSGPGEPDFLFAFYSKDNYIYLAEKQIKKSLKGLPKCKSIWDSINSESEKNFENYRQSGLNDTISFNKGLTLRDIAFDKYCECYRKEFVNDSQFELILKQLKEIVSYLDY